MNDPLDDIEAILTSICNDNKPDDNPALAITQLPDNVPDPNLPFLSPAKDATSPQTPALVNLLHQLHTTTNHSPIVQGKPKSSKTLHQANASKSNKLSTRPMEKIKKPRHPKKTIAKPRPKKSSAPAHVDPPIQEHPSPIIDDEIKVTTSADEADSNRFLQQMRRLAEEKLQTDKRKTEAIKQKTIKKMQDLTAQREKDMRRIAGVASKAISKGIASHKKSVPKDIDVTVAEIKKTLADEAAEEPAIVQDMNKFDGLLKKLESEMQSKRVHALQISHGREEKLLDDAAKRSSQGKKFTKVLSNVEGVLKLTGTKSP